MDQLAQPYPSREATFLAFEEHVNPGKARLYRELGVGLVMGARSGALFRDAFEGRSLYDCHCNGGVFNLGHRNPRLVAALVRALEHLDIGNHHLVSGWRARLASRLAATTGGLLPGVVFGVGGGEAVDLALKLARGLTGRQKVVSAKGGYHGHTGLAMAAGDPQFRDPFGPNLPGFVQVPWGDLEAMAREVDAETACVILEPIPATLGMPLPPPGYLKGVKEICRERGSLLILDEVQTGLGRTGTFWCYQQEGVEPDMLVAGKGLSGGLYPISATLVRGEALSFFETRPFIHVSTFGGAELGSALALEVLDIVEEEGFLDRVRELGKFFENSFEGLPFELRRRGMMMGFKFPREGDGILAAARLLAEGVFAVWAGNDTSVLQFLPPLVLTDAEAEEIASRVRRALGKGVKG